MLVWFVLNVWIAADRPLQGLVSRKAVERRLVLDGAAARLLTKLGECPRADRDGGHHW